MYSPKLGGAGEVWGRRDKTFVIPFRDILCAWGQYLFANDGNLDSVEVMIGDGNGSGGQGSPSKIS